MSTPKKSTKRANAAVAAVRRSASQQQLLKVLLESEAKEKGFISFEDDANGIEHYVKAGISADNGGWILRHAFFINDSKGLEITGALERLGKIARSLADSIDDKLASISS